jgi:polysaccharide export outer membrane protein
MECVDRTTSCNEWTFNLMVMTSSGPASAAAFHRPASKGSLQTSLAIVVALLVSGCTTAVGPSRGAITSQRTAAQIPGMQLISVTNEVARELAMSEPKSSFAEAIGDATPVGTIAGIGDVLEVTIWEAPPAVLFGGGTFETGIDSSLQGSHPRSLPETMVGPSGTITVPFAGQIPAAGRSLRQIEQTIVDRLRGMANKPQAIVRVARNATANVSVMGDVVTAGRVPLTPRGERVLDVIAQAGGTKSPVDLTTIQLTRGDRAVTMPLEAVVRDPHQNVILQRDDIITAFFQPNTFTVLGAAGKNEEVRFEGVGLTLSQALGRVGGLQDMRADPEGVFVFRWETPQRVRSLVEPQQPLPDGPVPVVYQVELKKPETFFAAQHFAMKNGDVMFIANSPRADFQRFMTLLASSTLPALSIVRTVNAQ